MTCLALGTVQFGLAYGITNQEGQVSQAESGRILELAASRNISLLDTAAAYGQSEQVLANLLVADHPFRLVSKTLPLSACTDGLLTLEQALRQSLHLLACGRPLYGLMVHHAADLLGPFGDALFARLDALKQEGRVMKVGVSVYEAEELDLLLARYPLDLVQLPHSLLDQRLRTSGWLERLSALRVEVHVRSAFLQGVLLLKPEHLPRHLAALKYPLERVAKRAELLGVTPLTLALAYLRQQTEIAEVIVGVLSVAQLDEIAHAWDQAANLPVGCADDLGIDDAGLLNPACWKKLENIA